MKSDVRFHIVMVSSLVLAAVKLALTGQFSIPGQATSWDTYFSTSAISTGQTLPNQAGAFIDSQIKKIKQKFTNALGEDATNALTANLAVIEDVANNVGFDEYDGIDDGDAINEVFDDNEGKIFLYMYLFEPAADNSVKFESLTVEYMFRLPDKEIILHNSKKSFLGSKEEWTETVYIPATVNDATIINGLSLALDPIVNGKTEAPIKLVQNLIDGANALDSSDETCEGDRKQIVVGSSVVTVTDPDLLAMIKPHWVSYSGKFSIQDSTNKWEFDE